MTSNQPLRINSVGTYFLVVVALLFLAIPVARAQDNANTNTNANTGSNTNTNTNTNANANTSQNSNANQGGGTAAALTLMGEARKDRLTNSNWFPLVIALMFALVLIPFAWTIMRAIRYSKHTFRSPLGLPEGSLRAMLAFMLVAFLGFYVLVSILSLTELKPPDFLLGIVATVIGFYFGSRTGEERASSAPASTGSVAGKVVDNANAPTVGATVELSQPSGRKLTSTTDSKGAYKFDNVPTGDYDARALLTGHSPSDIVKVKVKAEVTETANLKLKP